MNISSRCMTALCLVLCLAALGGCSDEFDPSDPALDGARLELVADQTQTLPFNGVTELRVRYLYDSGSVIPNAPIRYEIAGEAAGSQLAARSVTTGDTGEASIDLRAGNSNATFQVTVTPPRGDAQTFTIAVSDVDAGSLVVTLEYAGTRPFSRMSPYLFRGVTCATLNPSMLPTADIAGAPVDRLSRRPAFAGVPVASDYAIAVVAELDGSVAGFGCTDPVEILSQKETRATVTIGDLFGFDGTYELDNQLDFGGLLPGSTTNIIDILSELGDDQDVDCVSGSPDNCGQDPGAFLLDFVMRRTCKWDCLPGEDFDTCSEENHPMGDISAVYDSSWRVSYPSAPVASGACGIWQSVHIEAQNYVNEQVAMVLPASILGIVNSASDIAAAINNARISSTLELSPPSSEGAAAIAPTLETMTVTLRDLSGTPSTTEFNLREAGLTSLRAEATANVEGLVLSVPNHSFELHYGRLVQYIYTDILLPLLGYMSTAEMLASWVDCDGVADQLVMSLGTGIFGRMDYVDFCELGVASAGAALEASLPGLIAEAGSLNLMGQGNFVLPATSTTATALEAGVWMGSWGEGSATGGLTGTFMGPKR